MEIPLITSPLGILATLAGIISLFFFLERSTGWKLFNLFPPLVFTYAIPLILSNSGVIPSESPLFEWMGETVLPMLLVLMLLEIDVLAALRTMGRGILVLLCGTAGVILGAVAAFLLVKGGLGPGSWKAFGILAGSWIGGTGNMAAVNQGLNASPAEFGLAVMADAVIYTFWIAILLGSKKFAGLFNRFTRVDRKRIEMLEHTSGGLSDHKGKPEVRHLIYLLFLGFISAWAAGRMAVWFPEVPPVLSTAAWKILLVTTLGIILSLTPAKKIPGSRELAMALVYLFVAQMGARADVSGLARQASWFLPGAFVWILVHGTCCVLGARVLRVDIHSTAIASAANIGGIASASIVAAYHNRKLVPMGVLMALMGYAIGTYGAFAAAWLCWLVS